MKEKIISYLFEIITARINTAKTAMDAAQEAANSEGKSSAGDKYETSRAMGQIDRDMFAKQMDNAQKELSVLEKINFKKTFDTVGLGALVKTTAGYFMLAISIGKLQIEETTFIVISQNSPIGLDLMGKKVGDKFTFLGKENTILTIG